MRTESRWLASTEHCEPHGHRASSTRTSATALSAGIALARFFGALELQSPYESTDVTVLSIVMAVSCRNKLGALEVLSQSRNT